MWKSIKDFDRFEISQNAEIRNKTTLKLKKCTKLKSGYIYVSLQQDSKRRTISVHRLMAETFLPNYDQKRTVHHKDDNKSNNVLSNLEWATYSEQQNHRYKNKCSKIIRKRNDKPYLIPKKVRDLLNQAINEGLLTEKEIIEIYDTTTL